MRMAQTKPVQVAPLLKGSLQDLAACPELKLILITGEDTSDLKECYALYRDDARGVRLVRQDVTLLHSAVTTAFELGSPPIPMTTS